jgi:hypothetical protein
MSKYKERGPYHYVEFCDESSQYHKHVIDFVKNVDECYDLLESSVHEVGAGEGLILNQLSCLAHQVTGNDSDPEAVRMAHLLGNQVALMSDVTNLQPPDVVLFSDSLEHIENWREHLEWAMGAESVVIAVPDRHDAHGLRDFKIDSFDEMFKNWTCEHRATRHARHLLIFNQ